MSRSRATVVRKTAQQGKPSSPASRWVTILAAGVIVLAALAAYHNCFSVPFIFDDEGAITENQTIRHLWPIWDALSPPHGRGFTVEGRPLVNFSLAVNYAFGGTAVRGYHALNLIIHILAALTLFGVARRTLLQPILRGRFGAAAMPLALAVAVIWTVHPLQTESVTYVAQRAESLMGLFYLLTLYCFIRGVESPTPQRWHTLSVAACLLGMATKEVMVSAPLMVLLYDRTFVAGSFREAWRKHWRLYLGLASTWLVLGYLAAGTGTRGGTAGFQSKVTSWEYAMTQCWAVAHYLWLSVWPHSLAFDYGTELVKDAVKIVPCALLLAGLAAGTVIGLRRRPVIGFLGAWFFVILAPSSSAVPVVTQTMAEHRMYLPLAAVVALAVLGIHALIGRGGMAVFLALAVGLGFATSRRNEDYRSPLVLWSDTIMKRPGNARAHNNLGVVLLDRGQVTDAIARYEQALRLKPDYAEAHNNLGNALRKVGRKQEAIAHYEQALRIRTDYAEAHNNWGNALAEVGRVTEAIAHYEQALRIKPDYPEAHNNLGNVLVDVAPLSEGLGHYKEALRLKPDYPEAHNNLGNVLLDMGQPSEAMAHYNEALRLNPDYAEAHNNLGNALRKIGRTQEAIAQYEQALRLKSNYALAHNNLGNVLVDADRVTDAIAHYEQALRLNPDYADAHNNLGNILFDTGRLPDAMGHYKEALRIRPDYAEAHYGLGNTQLKMGQPSEAMAHYKEALRIKPDYPEAHYSSGIALFQLGKMEEAKVQFEQTLQLKPNYAEAHNNLGVVLAKSGQATEAIAHYEQALRIKPDYASARSNLVALQTLQQATIPKN
jgi:tetratricopeptide (TPR) repeat protein